jgi:hypothetical protein
LLTSEFYIANEMLLSNIFHVRLVPDVDKIIKDHLREFLCNISMWERNVMYRVLVGKPEGMRLLGRP